MFKVPYNFDLNVEYVSECCRYSDHFEPFYTKDFIKSFFFEVLSTLDLWSVWTGPQSHFRNIEKKSLGIYKEFLNISIYNVYEYTCCAFNVSDLE